MTFVYKNTFTLDRFMYTRFSSIIHKLGNNAKKKNVSTTIYTFPF